jgi:hypothetical protein
LPRTGCVQRSAHYSKLGHYGREESGGVATSVLIGRREQLLGL